MFSGGAIAAGSLVATWPITVFTVLVIGLTIFSIVRAIQPKLNGPTLLLLLALFGMSAEWVNLSISGAYAPVLSVLKWLALALPIVAVLLAGHRRSWRLLFSPSSSAARLFVALLVWSLLTLILRGRAEVPLLAKWASVSLLYVLTFVVIPAFARRPTAVQDIVRALAVFGVTVGGLSAVMLLARYSDAFVQGRFTGIMSNAIALALVLTPTTLSLLVIGLASSRVSIRILLLVLAAGVTALGVISGSRGSLFSLFVGILVLVLAKRDAGRMRHLVLITLTVLVTAFAASQLFSGFQIDPEQGVFRTFGGGSEEVRRGLLENSFDVLSVEPLNPVLGVGLGVVRETYYARVGLARPSSVTFQYAPYFTKFIHNSYVEALVETGVVGLLLLLLTIMTGIRAVRTSALRASRRDSIWHYGALAILISGMSEGLFNSIFLAPGSVFPIWFWTLLAVHASWASETLRGPSSLTGSDLRGGRVGGRGVVTGRK